MSTNDDFTAKESFDTQQMTILQEIAQNGFYEEKHSTFEKTTAIGYIIDYLSRYDDMILKKSTQQLFSSINKIDESIKSMKINESVMTNTYETPEIDLHEIVIPEIVVPEIYPPETDHSELVLHGDTNCIPILQGEVVSSIDSQSTPALPNRQIIQKQLFKSECSSKVVSQQVKRPTRSTTAAVQDKVSKKAQVERQISHASTKSSVVCNFDIKEESPLTGQNQNFARTIELFKSSDLESKTFYESVKSMMVHMWQPNKPGKKAKTSKRGGVNSGQQNQQNFSKNCEKISKEAFFYDKIKSILNDSHFRSKEFEELLYRICQLIQTVVMNGKLCSQKVVENELVTPMLDILNLDNPDTKPSWRTTQVLLWTIRDMSIYTELCSKMILSENNEPNSDKLMRICAKVVLEMLNYDDGNQGKDHESLKKDVFEILKNLLNYSGLSTQNVSTLVTLCRRRFKDDTSLLDFHVLTKCVTTKCVTRMKSDKTKIKSNLMVLLSEDGKYLMKKIEKTVELDNKKSGPLTDKKLQEQFFNILTIGGEFEVQFPMIEDKLFGSVKFENSIYRKNPFDENDGVYEQNYTKSSRETKLKCLTIISKLSKINPVQ